MPESKYEFVGARPDVRYFECDALSFLEERIKNWDVLFKEKGKASDAEVHDRTGKEWWDDYKRTSV